MPWDSVHGQENPEPCRIPQKRQSGGQTQAVKLLHQSLQLMLHLASKVAKGVNLESCHQRRNNSGEGCYLDLL